MTKPNVLFTKTMQHPEYSNLQVVFEAHEEDQLPQHHFDYKNDITLAEQGGSRWFMATVKVELKETSLFGYDSLACCSYLSYEEFLQDVYFSDMIEQATQDLLEDMNATSDKINEFVMEYNKAS